MLATLLGLTVGKTVGRILDVIAGFGFVVLVAIGLYYGAIGLLARHDAAIVKAQRAVCAAEKEGMVAQADYAALSAVLTRERENAARMASLAAKADERRREAVKAEEAAMAKLAELAKQTEGLPQWTPEELEWRRNH